MGRDMGMDIIQVVEGRLYRIPMAFSDGNDRTRNLRVSGRPIWNHAV